LPLRNSGRASPAATSFWQGKPCSYINLCVLGVPDGIGAGFGGEKIGVQSGCVKMRPLLNEMRALMDKKRRLMNKMRAIMDKNGVGMEHFERFPRLANLSASAAAKSAKGKNVPDSSA
jgi:hypothetical protein